MATKRPTTRGTNPMERFREIAQEMSRAAAEVKCSRQEYVSGLEEIASVLEMDLDAARENARAHGTVKP